MQAIQAYFDQTGGPDVIKWREVELAPPGPGQVTMANTAVGINFIDTYHRSGVYPVELPGTLGLEAAGIVVAIGPDVAGLEIGDRVVTSGPDRGAYSSARNVIAASLYKIPDGITDHVAAAALLKATTVEFLVERCARVEAGWQVLVHAAAGGVGLLLVQWLKSVGAEVIGVVSTAAKEDLAREAGADHVIRSDPAAIATQVREITGGRGVKVTFDGVGKSTWEASLAATSRRGLIVSYGNASGPVVGIGLGGLALAGSLFVTRPTLFDYYATPTEREVGIARVWDMIGSGRLVVKIGQSFPLTAAASAHEALETRATSGSTLLIP